MVAPRAGRVALVTGSSRGLGRAIAECLGAAGFALAVNGLPGDVDAQRVVDGIRADGGIAGCFLGDVTDEQQVGSLVDTVTGVLGPVEVLVLNATGPQPEAAAIDATWAHHLDQLEFFVQSPVLLARRVVPGMQARGFGRIIHIDSEIVDRPPPGRSAYAAAKSAQVGLTRAWAREFATDGITVNAVAPGFIPVERHADVAASEIEAYRASVPLGRMGTPDDVARAVAYFASDGAGFVTGQRLLVDGGRSLS